jgi:beta-galactosidase
MKKNFVRLLSLACCLIAGVVLNAQQNPGTESFNKNWKFFLGDVTKASNEDFNDAGWRSLQLPHDWSIELPFDSASPTGTGGGALRGGIGWYRKTFSLPASSKGKNIFIDFDGVYRNSEVFINGQSLGFRPNGYISFRYDLTPYLKYGNEKNVIVVKVDNSQQPNSRWYSGSGIYRNVWLVKTGKAYVDIWGTYVNTSSVSAPNWRSRKALCSSAPSGAGVSLAAYAIAWSRPPPARSGTSLPSRVQRPSRSSSTWITACPASSRPAATEAPDCSEISCSLERPPLRTATRIRGLCCWSWWSS